MADTKISAFGTDSSPTADDYINTIDITTGLNKKVTLQSILTAFLGATGWQALANAPNTITALGNRSYSCVFNATDLTGVISVGMRTKFTRNTAAPTKCTSLNGTTQFYSKTSPNKLTFTDDFTASAWVKLSSYSAAAMTIISRYNGTSGWQFRAESTGQIGLYGFNAASGNYSSVVSYQSIPLNKWVHVAAQLDMSAFTATTTTSYVMIDGVDVPASVTRAGTNPTALIQAGNLEIGSRNGGTQEFFPGKIAQVAVYSAKVTQATILASMNQTLVGTETSLASAYSFNNTILDLNTTTPNDLTASGSAVATTADSPFAQGAAAGTLEHGIVTGISFSTNTTVTVQAAEGSALPTSGTISAAAYSTHRTPYGFPAQRGKWQILASSISPETVPIGSTLSWINSHFQLNVPIGSWNISYAINIQLHSTVSGARNGIASLYSTSYNSLVNGSYLKPLTSQIPFITGSADGLSIVNNAYCFDMPTSDIFILSVSIVSATGSESYIVNGQTTPSFIVAECAYL